MARRCEADRSPVGRRAPTELRCSRRSELRNEPTSLLDQPWTQRGGQFKVNRLTIPKNLRAVVPLKPASLHSTCHEWPDMYDMSWRIPTCSTLLGHDLGSSEQAAHKRRLASRPGIGPRPRHVAKCNGRTRSRLVATLPLRNMHVRDRIDRSMCRETPRPHVVCESLRARAATASSTPSSTLASIARPDGCSEATCSGTATMAEVTGPSSGHRGRER